MDFHDSPKEAEFRANIRAFIDEHLPKDRSPALVMAEAYGEEGGAAADVAQRRWREALAERGWIAPHWPKEYGGAAMSTIEQFIFNEEMARVRAATFAGSGLMMIGPTLVIYGTEEQKKQHLPRITSGAVQWCQGYSEPGSGSDLASLQTRAVRDGDDFIINGQKIWTSGGHQASWMFMLARTDPDAPKHRGISMFLLDMKDPGYHRPPAGEHGKSAPL
jgi:alkylation response protein AidB-like acyl-CoA dehydrogenase